MIKLYMYILTIIARLISIIGYISAIAIVLIPLGFYRLIPDSFELPLGDFKGITVDLKGNIYCGLQMSGRIQVYNANGKYLYGKFLGESDVNPLRMNVNSDNQLEVVTSNGNLYIFDTNGNLLSKITKDTKYYEEFGKTGEYYYDDKTHDIKYIIVSRQFYFWGKQVVKIDSSNQEKVIIKTPFPLCMVMSFWETFIWIMLSSIISFIFDKKYRDKNLKRISKMEQQMQTIKGNNFWTADVFKKSPEEKKES